MKKKTKQRTSANGLWMLWFEILWSLIGSSLSETVYLMDFYYYLTLTENQQNNWTKGHRKAWICDLNAASHPVCHTDYYKDLST